MAALTSCHSIISRVVFIGKIILTYIFHIKIPSLEELKDLSDKPEVMDAFIAKEEPVSESFCVYV